MATSDATEMAVASTCRSQVETHTRDGFERRLSSVVSMRAADVHQN